MANLTGNGGTGQLARDLDRAAEALAGVDGTYLMRKASKRLAELETLEFALTKMQSILDAIAREVQAKKPRKGRGGQWGDLPGLVRKMVAENRRLTKFKR